MSGSPFLAIPIATLMISVMSSVSNDGRFEMSFVPLVDRASRTDLWVLKPDRHRVFGRISGTVVFDGAERLAVRDPLGSSEKVHNRW